MQKTNLKISLVFALLCGFSFCSCNKKETGQQMSHFVVGENSNSREAKERLSNKIHLSLLPIETTDSVLVDLSISKIYFDGDKIIVFDYTTGKFYIFDREGKYENKVDRKGQGPEEYNYGGRFYAKNGKLYVLDTDFIKQYDYQGNFLGRNKAEGLSRGEVAVTDNDEIYLRKNYVNPYQLLALDRNGETRWETLPPNEKMMGFSAPAGPEGQVIDALGEDIFIGIPMDQNIYLVQDTTLSVLASFDFGADNIPSNFFDQSEETVYDEFYKRRGNRLESKGFVYFDFIFINDNWIMLTPVGSQTTRLLLADRRTGETYGLEAFPDVLRQLIGQHEYITGYDKTTDSFVIGLTADKVKEDIEALLKEDMLEAFPELKTIDTDKINEEDNGYLLMIHID